ncbi:MAG TPA: hypothetical protein VMU73_07500 [Gaiellaceae bacterium]|nr:hypothetical protein [Gaiellaceae bacterium]
MRLGRALMACDLNPDYLEYWPSVRRAWTEIVGVEPLLVLIADDDRVPADLRADPLVIPFAPLPHVHTALQAQCIRLLYPAILDIEDAVIISDVDLFPLRRSYFVAPLERLDHRLFVSYRDVRLERKEVAIAFNAATPSTWAELFDVSDLAGVRLRLAEWTSEVEYDGRRAWPGWYRDQEILYDTLMRWPDAPNRWWAFDDDYTRYRRLDKLELEREDGLEPHRRKGLREGSYSDYVCMFPYGEHREVNDLVLRLALDAADDRSAR